MWRYSLLTAGGVSEPHAEWTMAAQTNIDAAIRDLASDMGTDLVVLNDDDLTPDEMRYRSLHSAVGQTAPTDHFRLVETAEQEPAVRLVARVRHPVAGSGQRRGLRPVRVLPRRAGVRRPYRLRGAGGGGRRLRVRGGGVRVCVARGPRNR
ncbi:MAG: hypothetical protein U5K38_09330 [Woeseiaceae bacterium]|nr:hypothetical protein [Woeseiaceae bacterium]